MMTGVASAASASFNHTGETLVPGENQTLGTVTVETASNVSDLLLVSDNFPFPVGKGDVTRSRVNGTTRFRFAVWAAPGESYPPGAYAHTLYATLTTGSASVAVNYSVAEVRNWTVQPQRLDGSVDAGANGVFANLTFQEHGNVEDPIAARIDGNASAFLQIDDQFTVPVNTPKTVRVTYDVRRDRRFGWYNGTVVLTSKQRGAELPVRVRVRDRSAPAIRGVSFPGFEASKPANFTVEVTDNIAVERVEATVRYTTNVTEDNETRLVNRTLETVRFRQLASDTWTGQLSTAGRVGRYFVSGRVVDAAGNNVSFQDRFTVRQLNVTRPASYLNISAWRVGESVSRHLMTVDRATPVTVRLEQFDQPLVDGNETWKVGLRLPDGEKRFFTEDDRTVEVQGRGDYRLLVYADVPQRYAGRVSFGFEADHVAVPPVSFNGRFVNFTIPRDQEFTVFETRHRCAAVRSDALAESGWNCTYFVPASTVPPGSDLEAEMKTVVPKDAERTTIQQYEERVASLTGRVSKLEGRNSDHWKGHLVAAFLLVYAVRYYPTHYSVKRKSTIGS